MSSGGGVEGDKTTPLYSEAAALHTQRTLTSFQEKKDSGEFTWGQHRQSACGFYDTVRDALGAKVQAGPCKSLGLQ